MAGYGSFEKAGSPGKLNKTISWVNKHWKCEPFIVELFQEINGERIPVNIDPKTVIITDTMDWLEKDGEPLRGEDKKWQVPVRIKESKLKELAPEGYNPKNWKRPIYEIGLPKPNMTRPGRHLSTTLTVTTEIVSHGESAISSATAAAAGVAGVGPAIAGAVSKLSKRDVVKSRPVEYVVAPLKPSWHVEQKKPVPLSGQGLSGITVITMSLPEGWDSGLKVTCSLPPEGSKKRGLEIVKIMDKESKSGSLAAELEIKNSILCMKKVDIVPDEPNTENFVLRISTQSEYLGTPLQETIIHIQPVDVGIYLDKQPKSKYPWNTNPVRVIRKDTEGVPTRSKLAVSLHHCKEFYPDFKHIKWSLPADEVQDEFKEPDKALSTYIAPKEEIWAENGKPEQRTFTCLAGPEEEETEIEKNLYSTVFFESQITLKEPVGYGIIKIALSPSGLPQAEEMDLINPDVLNQLHRVFCIKVDLQEIIDKKGGEPA